MIVWERIYNNPAQFFTWFVENCKSEVKETMLKKQRVKAENPSIQMTMNLKTR